MAKPGRRRKPTELSELHGTRRPDRHGDPELDVEVDGTIGDDAEPPAWMTDEQKAGWRYAVAYAPRSVLKGIDRATLALFVVAEDRFIRAVRKQNELDFGPDGKETSLPLLMKGQKGEAVVSPYVRVSTHAALLMLKAASELGFTPASRPRLNGSLGGEVPADPLPAMNAGRRTGGDSFDAYIRSNPNRTAKPN